MNKSTVTSLKVLMTIPLIVLASLMSSQAQADTSKRVYTGLSCQPHDPQSLSVDPANNYTIPNASYFGSSIFNNQVGFVDLGMNCAVDRSLFGRLAKLNSVTVSLLDNSDQTTPDDNSNCHTHIEYVSTGSMNVIYGTDTYATDAGAGVYQTLALPATVAAPTNDANYNIHCHISGEGAELNGYTVVEKN